MRHHRRRRHGRRHGPHRLHRRNFRWFGVAIVLTFVATRAVLGLLAPDGVERRLADAEQLAATAFALVWDDAEARARLAREAASRLDVGLRLEDPSGILLGEFGPACDAFEHETSVVRDGTTLGRIRGCVVHDRTARGPTVALTLVVVFALLWSLSLMVARHLTRPLRHIADVAERIGEGELGARVGDRPPGELGVLAERIDAMAARIERQLADQKALLAGVSHELRTPLGHMRVLLEMAKDSGLTPRALDELEAEVVEIDDLVGELLAHSRLELEATDRRRLDAVDLGRRALERAGLAPSLLVSPDAPTHVTGDATLLARAIANLLSNAIQHGGGPTALRIRHDGAWVEIAVEDAGPGFLPGELAAAFAPFRSGSSAPKHEAPGGLGLGLSLVRRIAEAHGGDARARNLVSGGCQVALRLPAA